MSGLTVFRGGRLVDPAAARDERADLAIDGERIADAGSAGSDATVVDADGWVLMPGVIDLGARLREPGESHKARIDTELLAAAAGGITAVCVPPDTRPVIDSPSVVEWIQDRATAAGGAAVHVLGAMTEGLHGEALTPLGPLQRAGCPAVMDVGDRPLSPRLRRRILEYADNFGLRVLVQARETSLDADSIAHDGATATRLGLPASPVSAETVAVAAWIELVADTGVPVHFCRLSAARSCELLRRAKADGLPVSADVAVHQLFLSDEALDGYDAMAHVYPPLRDVSDRDALRAAVADGTIDAICSDHQPHETDAKVNPLPLTQKGISGLDTLLALVWSLVDDGVLDASAAVRALSLAPARILGLPEPDLAPGSTATLTAIDTTADWTLTREDMHSAGRNTPFAGHRFGARAVRTVIAGRTSWPRG